jgi:hypothetical protein
MIKRAIVLLGPNDELLRYSPNAEIAVLEDTSTSTHTAYEIKMMPDDEQGTP